jgi:hypothetical protein
MSKRKHQDEILQELGSYGLDTLASQLQAEGGRARVAQAALTLAYLGGLTIPELQTFSETVPAFNKARWEKIAPEFGLDVDKDMTQLKLFSVPRAFLPPSFHRKVMKNSAWYLDVYQETGSHSREAARVRLMDAVSTWSSRWELPEVFCISVACTRLCFVPRSCRWSPRTPHASDAGNIWRMGWARSVHDRRDYFDSYWAQASLQESWGSYRATSVGASL